MPVYVAEEREFENEEFVEMADDLVESSFARAGRKPSGNVGRGPIVFQRGQVFRRRGSE